MSILKERLALEVRKACVELPEDVKKAVKDAYDVESAQDTVASKAAATVLGSILKNLEIAEKTRVPMCQDTGMFDVFVDIGRDCRATIGQIEKDINAALEEAVIKASYRRSVVSEPVFDRPNTGINLPPIITWNPVDGDGLKISVLLKGFGSENCSSVRMLLPTGGADAVVNGVIDIVKTAGGKPCPPICLGVGIGGTMERAAWLSKRALLREVNSPNPDARYAELEKRILNEVNKLGIGSGGFGGKITALSCCIEQEATHIAGMPLAVSINCWADRKAVVEIKGEEL